MKHHERAALLSNNNTYETAQQIQGFVTADTILITRIDFYIRVTSVDKSFSLMHRN